MPSTTAKDCQDETEEKSVLRTTSCICDFRSCRTIDRGLAVVFMILDLVEPVTVCCRHAGMYAND